MKEFFVDHQKQILTLANSSIGWAVRRSLRVQDTRPLVNISPHNYSVLLPDGKVKTTLHIDAHHAQAIRKNYGWLLSKVHAWDMRVANRWLPALNAGFDSYSSQPDGTAGKDSYITSGAATTNFGTNTNIGVGEDSGGANISRTAIAFDLSSIPSSNTTSAATLTTTITTDESSNARDFKIYRILRDWVEAEITWNIWKTANNWTTAGAGSDGNDTDLTTVWGSVSMGASDTGAKVWTFSSTGLTELDKFINGTYSNYGWLLKADTETNDRYFFASSDHATSGSRPLLEITHSSSAGGYIVFM